MKETTALWRRLDIPGHDSCRLTKTRRAGGWKLDGNAVFLQDNTPASLAYHVSCDAKWRTHECEVRGWIGTHAIQCKVTHANGGWTFNGATVDGVDDCVDIDLGFTPATNFLQLQRIALADDEEAEVPVAWLDAGCTALTRLPQHYLRRTKNAYWYEAPSVGYAAQLELNDAGFISLYPKLWEIEA